LANCASKAWSGYTAVNFLDHNSFDCAALLNGSGSLWQQIKVPFGGRHPVANILFAARTAASKAFNAVSEDALSSEAHHQTAMTKPSFGSEVLAEIQPPPSNSPASFRAIGAILRHDTEGLNVPARTGIVVACMLLGLVFFPMLLVGAFIGWCILKDIWNAPLTRAQNDDTAARIYANSIIPMSVEYLRKCCDSPAETAFLDAMVSGYDLKAGPGAATGRGLRLRSQIPMGRAEFYSHKVHYPYRADFLVDEKLVVEIDGAAFHSSPEAVVHDRIRDEHLQKEGYTILRIPAKVVFNNPKEAVKRVELARAAMRIS
jgi:very-short-patch-repair endonuclease